MLVDLALLTIIAQTGASEAPQHMTWWDIIRGAGLMVKFVMLLLAWFSVMCWGIVILKFMQFRKARAANAKFMASFWGGSSLETIFRDARSMRGSPLANVFISGYNELQKIKKLKQGGAAGERQEGLVAHLGGIESIERALRTGMSEQRSRLEKYLSFLATTGSTAPFVGLFGTVWGIMTSFRQIAVMGDVGLEVVAPGISEALIATAAGLAAAIPAVVAYNYFLAQSRGINNEMENFSGDLLNIIERHFI